ncbi:hypothetical protein BJ912DRAFT_890300 [Pholiota molesta]|nr:hypothetical protein BJ912DRAFT_890300 [Pholiota molesta]
MPGKHVHFNAASYAGSSTPSPSFSTSTLPSSPGPFTPPPLGYGSPYRSAPLPGIEASLHSVLAAGPNPAVAYDLCYPPESLKPLIHTLPANIFEQPATSPPVPFMEISCPKLPWRITVMPRSKKIGYVTIGDVFAALYRALRLNVSQEEFALVPSAEGQTIINNAYRFRYKRQPDAQSYQEEKDKGLKRVDFLGLQTRFMGLVPAKGGAEGWILLV